MSPSGVVDECLRTVNTSSEEVSWPHPVESELDTVPRTYEETER